MIISNLITFIQTQSKQQVMLESIINAKANSSEISSILNKVSEEMYRNFELISSVKHSSSTIMDNMTEGSIDPEGVRLRKSLTNFGDSIRHISNNIVKLNQSRISLEKKYNDIVIIKEQITHKKEVKEWFENLKKQITENVYK